MPTRETARRRDGRQRRHPPARQSPTIGAHLEWTERILAFPVRTAAVDEFLAELKRKRAGDLNAVLTTFNDSSLCREALSHWLRNGWIVVAPHSPLIALAGPEFTRDLTLRSFCGEPMKNPPEEAGEDARPAKMGEKEANE